MSRLDYSKWDHIEVSDDEDDTHPNIDTPSLFRWRHKARLDRMAEREQEWNELKKGKEKHNEKMMEIQQKLKNNNITDSELARMKMTKEELERQEVEFHKKEEELVKKDKLTPWNIDTLCKDGFSKSIINKTEETPTEKSDEQYFAEQKEFQRKYDKELQHYGMLSKPADSRKYLQDHPHLVSDKAANFLVIWCIDLEVEEKHSLMERVAHQTIILQFILQLATSMKTDPRNCYNAFFDKFQSLQSDYMDSFNDELSSFKSRIRERAKVRTEEAIKKYEEEQREKELGPGGLHPVEVMESLPAELRECFEKQDIPMLQKVVASMDQDEAKYHIKRCVDSGLWVPGGGNNSIATEQNEDVTSDDEVKTENSDENVYEEAKSEDAVDSS